VDHHADVIRRSIAAQRKHRETERDRQRTKLAAKRDVGTNVGETQSVGQTVRTATNRTEILQGAMGGDLDGEVQDDPWFVSPGGWDAP
jgi:hypothetical protein